jgi:hypothetical protein
LNLVGLQRKRHQPNHHPLIRLARMSSQRQRMISIVAMVNISDLDVGFIDGGFDGHKHSIQETKKAPRQRGCGAFSKLAEAVRFELTGDSHPRQFSRLLV